MNNWVKETEQLGAGLAHGTARLASGALQEAVRGVEPRALVVRPRILRRVIAQDRELAGLAIRLPHRKCYVIGREPLLAIVDPDELGLLPGDPVPDRAILLPQPSDSKLAETPAGELLLQYWRLLFHARIHLELDERLAAGGITAAAVRERIRRIGGVEFEEIRAVLAQEAFLLPPRDEVSAYCEFAAVYWELRYFAQALLPRYFPGVEDFHRIETILAEDVDARRVFQATRLPGLPDGATTDSIGPIQARKASGEEGQVDSPPGGAPAEAAYRRLIRRAEEAARRGNVVRSAICRARAEQKATPELAAKARSTLKRDVDRLVRRLQVALSIEDEDPHPWQEALLALARETPRGVWTAEARLLYDLQKVCLDHERRAYRVDLVRWAVSLGRQPIHRPLPAQREVAISKHLRSAVRRVPAVGLTEAMRQRLSGLLETATHHAEVRLRDRFRPAVTRALDDAGLRPHNVPEKVAWKKLVAELLDRIVESGHLTMGDLRDALSRNNLKLADFSWHADGLRGDPLLRADQKLAASLDGVHRRGEFYLRWMQRLSSLGFGTVLGRLATRFLVVPFGGTYLVVAFLDHLVEKVTGDESAAGVSITWSVLRVVLLGTFLLGILNVDWFRHGAWRVLVESCRAVGDLAVGVARWVRGIEWLNRLLRSRLARLAYRFVLKPLAFTALASFVLPGAVGWKTSLASGAGLFLAINLVLNSRVGRDLEEQFVDGLMQAWRRLGIPIFTGLFYFVVDIFRGVLEAMERLIYTVDEWLQFRSGETRLKFAMKAALGPVWLFVAYVLRFCINLLIEPQINPIKHFPVVTVSHKLLIPCIPAFIGLLEQTMDKNVAKIVATAIIFGIPGVFGFLVWELKENWRLYAANRARDLPPSVVGQHGETMGRLLRPGFHSGTVPKLFGKLRRAERRTHAGGSDHAVVKQLRAIGRVQMAVQRFVERELLELLSHARWRQAGAVVLGSIHLSTNRIRIVLDRSAEANRPLELALDMRSGWLVAGVLRPGWTARLEPAERLVLETALAGLYKLAGVEMIRAQLCAILPQSAEWDVAGEGLVLDTQDGQRTPVSYNLRREGPIAPQVAGGRPWQTFPTLDPSQVFFTHVPVGWDRWVEFWQGVENRRESQAEPILAIRVLPPADGRSL
jgi:hypothetical protein